MSLLKLNPDLFLNAKDTDMIGELGIPAIMRHFMFKEVRREVDIQRGEVVFLTINGVHSDLMKNDQSIGQIKFEGEIALLAKDLIPA